MAIEWFNRLEFPQVVYSFIESFRISNSLSGERNMRAVAIIKDVAVVISLFSVFFGYFVVFAFFMVV